MTNFRIVSAIRREETQTWGRNPRRQASVLAAFLAIAVGAAILLWPAFLNGYPILFSDTHAFLIQGAVPRMVWDKPFAYGPLLRLLHGGATLWLPAIAQGLLVSHMLWLTRLAFAEPSALRHVAVCAALATLSSCAWATTLLMPDIFAAVTVLSLFLLAFGDRLERPNVMWLGLVAGIAIAVHLSHLIIAAACLLVVAVMRTVRAPRVAAPLLAAIGFLILTNLIGYGRFAVSPSGSVFLLARLVADGPAAETLARDCPVVGWRLCAWSGRLPADSDDFLWDPNGPVWRYPGGPPAMAREASAIVAATLKSDPAGVLRAAGRNAFQQFFMVDLGDTLHDTWLEGSVTNSLRDYFPPRELARYRASLQAADALAVHAASFTLPLHAALAGGGLMVVLMFASVALYGRATRPAFAAMILAGVLANAVATGALSHPHDRYQARIAWLLVAAPLLAGVQLHRRGED